MKAVNIIIPFLEVLNLDLKKELSAPRLLGLGIKDFLYYASFALLVLTVVWFYQPDGKERLKCIAFQPIIEKAVECKNELHGNFVCINGLKYEWQLAGRQGLVCGDLVYSDEDKVEQENVTWIDESTLGQPWDVNKSSVVPVVNGSVERDVRVVSYILNKGENNNG